MPVIDQLLRQASMVAWAICLACLLPPVVRLLSGRGRYTDPIWALSFLGIANRLSFLLRVSPLVSHATSIGIAVAVFLFSIWYQRHDA